MSLSRDIASVLAPPHPAGRPFIIGGLIVAAIGLVLSLWIAALWIFALGALFSLFCLYFFRDPERIPPGRAGAFLAPADGKIVAIRQAEPPPELGLGDAPRCRVSIFLTVLNVHVNRIPADGVVSRVAYHRGAYLSASLDKASDVNERNALAIRLPSGHDIAVVQIAGLIARRILCTVQAGSAVQAGQRFGIIRFGSRTDLYLPPGVVPLVREGQTMIGGETVIAALPAP
jgi:phosphatidylserine decarboxylase